MNISVIGLDIAKQIFHLVGLDGTGRGVLKKKLRRSQVLAYFASLGPCTVGLEGCAGCHYWARELTKLGHHAKTLPAQHVKAYVRGNKNGYNDALGIAEATRIPELRAVAAKTVGQQSLQALHRVRRGAPSQTGRGWSTKCGGCPVNLALSLGKASAY
jgi:transposase